MNTSNSELLFISQLKSGDMAAFKTVFHKYYARLVCYAYQMVHDRAESESIVDDVMVNLWRNRENLNPDQHLESYLLRKDARYKQKALILP